MKNLKKINIKNLTMKSKKKKKFELPTKLSFYIGLLITGLATVLLFKFIVPLALGIMYMYISLVKLYTLLDTNGKFYGGIFFFIVFWYIFNALVNIMIILFKYGYKKINEGLR